MAHAFLIPPSPILLLALKSRSSPMRNGSFAERKFHDAWRRSAELPPEERGKLNRAGCIRVVAAIDAD
jgi:hypothetical protein